MTSETPTQARSRSAARGLKRFDTTPFTLHEHCGFHAAAVRDCLRNHKVEEVDFAALEDDGWRAAPACRPLWESYRECGLAFFTATDWAQSKCAAEAEAFCACSPHLHGAEHCKELELQMARYHGLLDASV